MRIDAAAFASLFPKARRVDSDALEALRRAVAVLRAVVARGDDLFKVVVPSGARLGIAVNAALGGVGRAFGAVMLAEVVRGGRYHAAQHDRLLDEVEFLAWNKVERRFAPPLIIEVDGADLHAGALTDFADGREKLVLVVRGPCGPAPLARCITPGTLVLQTTDGSGLDRVASFDGPAIAASGECTFSNTLDIMGWDVADDGLKAIFSRDIPGLVENEMREVASQYLAEYDLTLRDVDTFLSHPGGAKVLDALEHSFGLSDGGLAESRSVLRDYGNMSAATVMFVLERALHGGSLAAPAFRRALVTSMGPGFTAAFATLERS